MFSGIKSYLYIGLAFAAIAFATMGFRWFTGIQAEVTNLRQANAEYSIQVNALQIQRGNDAAVIEQLQLAADMQSEALEIVNEQFGEIRDEREQQQRVLEGSRLARLAAARAALIETRSNVATQNLMTQFEGVINEDF